MVYNGNIVLYRKNKILDLLVIVCYYRGMSYYSLKGVDKPDFEPSFDVMSYGEMKNYFHALAKGGDAMFATKSFLSNVEGLGDYLDKHKFFDFQAYLILNLYWFEKHGKVLNYLTLEYRNFAENLQLLMSDKIDGWASAEDVELMKCDANKLLKLYYLEEK